MLLDYLVTLYNKGRQVDLVDCPAASLHTVLNTVAPLKRKVVNQWRLA